MNYVPDHVPLHHSVLKEFHYLKTHDNSRIFEEARVQFLESTNQFVQHGVDTDDPISHIQNLSSTYQSFLALQEDYNAFSDRFNAIKHEYKTQCDALPEVNLETWDSYKDGEITAPSFSALYEGNMLQKDYSQVSLPLYSNDDISKVLKALPYIWQDPTCVIPDDNMDEDDLQIAGGSIELTCPITCKPYEKPMISKKCGHVFDLSGIQEYLKDHRGPKKCPQGACGQEVEMRDFVQDPIMEVRCKIASVKKNKKDQDQEAGLITL